MRRTLPAALIAALAFAAPAVAMPVAEPAGHTEAMPVADPAGHTEAMPVAEPAGQTEAMPVADPAGPSAMDGASAALSRITAKGVGQVKLGMRFGELREKGLVGRLRRGCELAPDERVARLRSPLRGSVTFVERKATGITVTRGAAARGVRIGDRIRDIRDAYPRARVVRTTEGMFGITLVKVPKRGGGRIQFAVSVESGEIDLIAVPVVRFCE